MQLIDMIYRFKSSSILKKTLRILTICFFSLYIFSLPTFSGRSPWNYVSYVLMAGLIVSTFTYLLLFDKIVFKKRLILLPMFVAIAFIGTAFYSHEFRNWLTLVLLTMTFFVFYYSFYVIKNIRFLLYLICACLLAFTLVFIIYYRNDIIHLSSTIANGNRLGGFFDNVNQIGSYMSIGVIVSLYLSVMFERKIELLSLGFTIIFFFVGLLTGSRTFIVSTFIGLFILLFIRFKKHKVLLFIILVALIALFFLLINLPFMSFLKSQLLDSIYTVFGIGNFGVRIDTSTLERVLWQKYGFYLGSRNLLLGYGFGGFSVYSGVGTYTHGNFSEVLCNFGFFGLVSFYLCIFIPFVFMFFAKKKNKYLIPLFFIHYVLNSILNVYYYDKELYLVVAIMFYLIKDIDISEIINKGYFYTKIKNYNYTKIDI